MTAAGFDEMTNCPENEELAAFYEGRLNAAARERVVEHLASCAVCMDIMEGLHAYTHEEANVVRGRFGRKPWIAAVAAAAVAVAVFLSMRPTGMERLEGAWGHLEERPTLARFSGDFPYRKLHTMRGGEEERNAYAAQAEAYKVIQRSSNSADGLHASGVALLIADPIQNRDDAVARLDEAARKKPTVQVLTDLSAAYYAAANYNAALQAADRALKLERTPAALWNRALALEGLGRDKEALAAWNEYLQLDPQSEWATEVRARIQP